ncbi:MAG: DUF4854 domain-containing protein [Lachnospiraceae bacterium]|nr:DUF4854 domain-containing protein [Lachnospiraceae bacterium]
MKKRTVKTIVCAALMAVALSVTACGSNKTLEDYMNSAPEEMKELEDQMATASADGMSISVDVKGNEFTYVYTFEDAALLTDEVRENITSGLEASASLFEMMAQQLDEAIEQKNAVTLTVKYVDPDGNVIGEQSYKAPEE